jgi:hypothetical protein
VKQAEIGIGGHYWMKINGFIVIILVKEQHERPKIYGGKLSRNKKTITWTVENLKTGREIHAKSSHAFRAPATEFDVQRFKQTVGARRSSCLNS